MTVRQDRYVDPDTSVIRVKETGIIEAPKIPDNPTLRASDVQQTVNNSTLPVSSRAVKLIIDGYATEDYVDQKFNLIDLSSYASTTYVDGEIGAVDAKIASTSGSIAEAQERADGAYSLAESKVDEAYVDSKLAGYVTPESLTGTLAPYAKTSEVDSKIADYSVTVNTRLESVSTEIASVSEEAVGAQERADSAYSLADSKVDKAYVDSKVGSIDLSVYALKSDLSSYLTTEGAESLATKEELKSYATLSDVSGLATEEYVDSKVGAIDLSGYATRQYVDSELTLKADKSQLEGLATKAWVEERLSEFMTEVRGEIEKLKNEEPADGGV